MVTPDHPHRTVTVRSICRGPEPKPQGMGLCKSQAGLRSLGSDAKTQADTNAKRISRQRDPRYGSQTWVLAKPNVGFWQTPKPRAGIGFSLQNPKSSKANFGLLAVPKLGCIVGDLPKPKNFMQIPTPQIPSWEQRSPRLTRRCLVLGRPSE